MPDLPALAPPPGGPPPGMPMPGAGPMAPPAPPMSPPSPPQPSPQDMQAFQELQAQAKKLQENRQVLALLRDEKTRGFRIEIETDSTIEPDESAEKSARVEFLTAVSNFMKEAIPAVQTTPQLLPMLKEMLLFMVRGFRAGRSMEDVIERAFSQLGEAAHQDRPDPEAAKNQALLAQKDQQHKHELEQKDVQHKQTLQQNADQFKQEQDRKTQEFQQTKDIELQKHALDRDATREDRQLDRIDRSQEHHERQQDATRQHAERRSDSEVQHAQKRSDGQTQHDQRQQSDNQKHENTLAATREDRTAAREDAKQSETMKHEQTGLPAFMKTAEARDEKLSKAMVVLSETLAKALEELSAPREIVRDGKGIATGVRKSAAKTDAAGAKAPAAATQ